MLPDNSPKLHQALGRPSSFPEVLWLWQVHSSRIIWVDTPADISRIQQMHRVPADGLFTCFPEVIPGVQTADCVPVAVLHPEWWGVVHAGWRGILHGILQKMIEGLSLRVSSRSTPIRVVMGPCARICCYRVRNPVWKWFRQRFPREWMAPADAGDTEGFLDLPEIARYILLQESDRWKLPIQVEIQGWCSICTEFLPSWRRDQERTLRLLTWISGTRNPSFPLTASKSPSSWKNH